MSFALDGYRTTRLLRSSPSTKVYAAVREQDQRSVVAKVYELAGDEGLEARVEHEFRLIHDLEVEGVVRALALERAGTKIAVVLEWCEGVNLEQFCAGRPLALEVFFEIALQLTRSLAAVHAQRVIHRDIKPTNILIDPETHVVSIADFGISVLLESERQRINDPAVVAGTLPFVSPEQTGRTRREVDFRSDLYSLGVTFYEMLTARRPFEARSPLELIHAHLARRPEAPHWLRAEIPAPLSAIVMKLLEKAPERRYQSAQGLRADLVRLDAALREGHGLDHFELGIDDVPMTLQLPHRLYGRSVEVELLIREYRRIATGEPRFVLISGPAGIGKTALIAQLAEPVMGRQGFLARGKFDREQSDKPYAGFVVALTDLVEQLLTETDEQLQHWRREILLALESLASAMCELVPKLRMVIGSTPAMVDVGPAEAHNRTALACARLISVFARAEHPLALALDDVHWADRASCELLAALLAEPRGALLVLATIRMDELSGGHPLREVIDECEAERDQILWLDLGPLGRREIAAMVGDSLARSPDDVLSLAALVGRKANQNPFFIRQFLAHLVDLNLLRATAEGWAWDEQAIELAGIPDDLLEMMTEKLARLDDGPRELLTVAAVIGTRFDVATLEFTAGSKHLGRGLVRLVEEGLLTAVGASRYAFTHDRIREVAYTMISLERRCALHEQIGQFRLDRVGLNDLADAVFDLVDHLDLGCGLIPLSDEDPAAASARAERALDQMDEFARGNLAELNALAGYKALNGGAAATAASYLEAGVKLLERESGFPDPGDPGHTLRLALELGLSQALALCGQRDRSEQRFETLLRRRVEPSDYGRIVSKRIEGHVLASDRRAALTVGLAGLRALGYDVETSRGKLEVGAGLLRQLPNLRPKQLRGLIARPRAEEPKAKAAMSILMMLGSVAHFVDRTMHVALVATHVQLLLVHGRHTSGPLALTQLGLLLAAASRELGIEVLAVAQELAELEGPAAMRHRMDMFRSLVMSWRQPFTEVLTPLRDAGARAFEAGDIEFAGYATGMQCSLSFASGLHLRALERATEVAVHRLQQWNARTLVPPPMAHLDFARLMLSGDEELLVLPDPLGFEAIDKSPELTRARLSVAKLQAQLFFLFGRHREAMASLDAHEREFEAQSLAAWEVGSYLEVRGLLAAALYARASRVERVRLMWMIERCHRRLRRYVSEGTVAFEAGALLLEAELVAIRGPIMRAFELFRQARHKAAEQRALMTEAIALERMAVHARARGLDELALGPLREARARYHYWGAFTKVAALERRWPALTRDDASVSEGPRDPGESTSGTRTGRASHGRSRSKSGDSTGTLRQTASGSGSTSAQALDMATILQTSAAISAELRLDEVIGRVMELALENAGADRGALLLRIDGRTALVALCSADQPLQNFLRDPVPLTEVGSRAPLSLLHFVERTREPAIFDDIATDLRFASDPYVDHQRVRSVLCLPILKQGQYVGLLYLENKLSPRSFTQDRLQVLELLVTQAASALENARLYEQLRASEVRWRSLVEGLPDVVMLVDRTGRVEFLNHADHVERVIHQGHAEPDRRANRLAGEFIDAAYLPQLRAAMAEVIRDAEHRELELRAHFLSGESRWYTARLAPIVVDGRVDRVIAVGTDITARREAEASHAQLEAVLRQQQRLESIGTLASGVAHEINNPVQGIMNYAELIASSEDVSDMTREFAEEIGHESQRVATIVRNLLAFSRQEGDRAATPAKLADIVEGTLSLIRTVLRKDQIALHIDIPDTLPSVDCRVQQIQQVIMNLVTNARDAVGGRWPDYHEKKRIEIVGSTFERNGQPWVRLTVTDTGGGVPEDVVARIFDPFFTTKGRDQGTGLGLAVSHGIVAEHGGELRLENEPGVSASFHLELPNKTI
ncbi:trifunctional serine/threonine-protein kinase/ATP-binding protein/sensor histidine kinase [Enhygromyxa salina]|uniref:histidine kinase n=1 Tax=Enhygromyxa salina TaxID=215803 RepID=A0A2S9YW00_9BACT|nr:AAA family ATPase [Enhygromyxa salina]PRQ09254.1 Serine/threonine-protein kinase PknB [Enhygromyxa salina]